MRWPLGLSNLWPLEWAGMILGAVGLGILSHRQLARLLFS
ncbi:hypothetical protein CYB_2884 [Synechococcus sp. JA-2-3B'a(2-13)]|nr:hypothetical protein CYB_2884 [Synechococcus sp. JA-2-3B'a(2-13)]